MLQKQGFFSTLFLYRTQVSLSSRFHGENRQASQKVRALLREQWSREQSV